MALPINIKELINGSSIEWERLEFKKSWNPEEVAHTMCAFANDLNNWGGGYIIIGIAEKNGKAILPPFGIEPENLDKIQGEVLQLAHQIQPAYFPVMQPYLLEGKHILVIWCPAGDNRPYSVLSTQGKNARRQMYIRFGSRSIVARGENLRRLYELTARIPFDDRINGMAQLDDLDLGLIQAYLQEVKSELLEESKKISFTDLCRTMVIAKGPDEDLRPLNVGLLFFCKEPERFMPRTWIELVIHRDNSGKNFSEKYFKGPVHIQLQATLDFIKTHYIIEIVNKISGEEKAERYFNVPFNALEEALSNAVYHKSYEPGKPIEVQLWPDKIEILSFPGPIPPVDAQILKKNKRIVARDYRNRRIGDFLKELHLTEGRGTGFPIIYSSMQQNGSPEPVFETDEQCTYFLTVLPARSDKTGNQVKENGNQVNNLLFNNIEELNTFLSTTGNQVSNQVSNQARKLLDNMNSKVVDILNFSAEPVKRNEILKFIGLSNQSKNRKKYIDPLIENGWLEKLYPEKATRPDQKYRLTELGKKLLNLINNKK